MSSFSNTFELVLHKSAERALRGNIIDGQVIKLTSSVQTKSLSVKGWSVTLNPQEDYSLQTHNWRQTYDDKGNYLFLMYAKLVYVSDTQSYDKDDLRRILTTFAKRAIQPNYGGWLLATVNGDEYQMPADSEPGVGTTADMKEYAPIEIPEDWDTYFSHLYGLNSHIALVRSALEAGIESKWENRFHAVLTGPPGCGKSDICRSLKAALGDDAVMEFDATSTTAAGAIKEITEREILPRVMVVEEIEKADSSSLQWLLGLADLRAEIRKTTARDVIQRSTKMLVICTVNNYELFESMQAGALESRMTNKIGFGRPSRETLAMILNREIEKINGDPDWIKPTLDYCEEIDTDDPRQVIAICLCGREKLLTGEYQAMLQATRITHRKS